MPGNRAFPERLVIPVVREGADLPVVDVGESPGERIDRGKPALGSIREEPEGACPGGGSDRNSNGRGLSKASRYEYLLQGLVVCGYCRGRMVPRTSLGRDGQPYHYYICGRADRTAGLGCRQNHLNAVEADGHVLEHVKRLALREDLVRKLCRSTEESWVTSL